MKKLFLRGLLGLLILMGLGTPLFAQQTATQTLTLTVNTPALTFTGPTILPYGIASVPYSQTLTVTGGTAPYTFSISAGSLPAGLTVSSAGIISGVPSAVAPGSSFTVRVQDSASIPGVVTQTFAAGIQIVAKLTITTTTLPSAVIGVPYIGIVQFTGGVGPYTCSVSAGSLPAWSVLAVQGNTCTITGTPTGVLASTFTIQVGSAQ